VLLTVSAFLIGLQFSFRLAGSLGLLLLSHYSFAEIKPGPIRSYNAEFLFIENRHDSEYFIAPEALDPRFSGANVWTKYGRKAKNQDSLGYMGVVGWVDVSRYTDMWINEPFTAFPFTGIRCRIGSNSDCPADGVFRGEYTDKNGFYKAWSGSGTFGGAYGFASFSPGAYEALRNMRVGMSETSQLNRCTTKIDYDPHKGERCIEQSVGVWDRANYTHTKIGHLTLHDTNAAIEIWTTSDGTPYLVEDREFCDYAVKGKDDAIVCKMLSYDYEAARESTSKLVFNLIPDEKALGVNLSSADIELSGDKLKWYNYGANTAFKNIYTPGKNKYVYVRFNKGFFTKLAGKNGAKTIQGERDLFTFNFDQTALPESGFYQISSSTLIDILPREYGIGIRPYPDSVDMKTGNIGSSTSLDFNYIVTLSGTRMADQVTAKVIGEQAIKDQITYCKFEPEQKNYHVNIPAYLSYKTATGNRKTVSSSCTGEAISILDAAWRVEPWDIIGAGGSYFSTDLRLSFPMDNPISWWTDTGQNWEGTVSAEGKVVVEATWLDVP